MYDLNIYMVYQRRRCIGNPRRFKNVGEETLGYDVIYKLVSFGVCPEVKQIDIIVTLQCIVFIRYFTLYL